MNKLLRDFESFAIEKVPKYRNLNSGWVV